MKEKFTGIMHQWAGNNLSDISLEHNQTEVSCVLCFHSHPVNSYAVRLDELTFDLFTSQYMYPDESKEEFMLLTYCYY